MYGKANIHLLKGKVLHKYVPTFSWTFVWDTHTYFHFNLQSIQKLIKVCSLKSHGKVGCPWIMATIVQWSPQLSAPKIVSLEYPDCSKIGNMYV